MSEEIRLKPANFKAVFGKQFGTILFVAFAVCAIAVAYLQTPTTSPNESYVALYNELRSKHEFQVDQSIKNTGEKAKVTDIVDGDTIKVESNGKTYTVRYIGIDTPEIKHQNGSSDQPYGQEAKTVNSWLLSGKNVYLKKDVTETDKYGRLLRFIYLEDGTMVNDVLIRMGYAHILTIPPNVSLQSVFLKSQQSAREEKLNLWK